MADKKKMSVAEILAAARKVDGARSTGTTPSDESTKPEESPATAAAPAPKAVPAAAAAKSKPVPKPGAAGRPSVAEMMAMARAGGKAKGEAPAAPQKQSAEAKQPAAAEKPAPKPAVAKQPAVEEAIPGGPKDTASILAAARKTAKPGPLTKQEAAMKSGSVAAKEKPDMPAVKEKRTAAVPPMPAKPEYAKRPAPKPVEEDRRSFLSVALGTFLGLGFTALAGTGGLWTLGFARFMFPNILTEPPSKFKVGPPDAFPPGYVETKFVAQFGVWVVKGEYNGQTQVYALRTVCTHLGCTPNWLEAEQKFKCPCHGSGFYKDGINFEGPAPRPLERYAISLASDGQLEIDKGKIFQEEMGQWNDPACFYAV